MPDETSGQDAQTETTPAQDATTEQAQDANAQNNIGGLPSWAQEYISELRQEAAQHRTRAKQVEQEKLAEQGRWKELAEQRQRELDEATAYKDRYTALEKLLNDSNKQRIERIPEDMRPIVPTEYAPEKLSAWLDANMDRLMRKPAPSTDAGAGTGSSGHAPLTPEEIESGRLMGLTEEQLLKTKARLQAQNKQE